MYRMKLHQNAIQDMEEIGKYIAETLRSPLSAHNLNHRFHEAVKNLTELPHRCPVVELTKPFKQQVDEEYRKLRVENYLMLYHINETEKTVTITRVIYNRRNYLSNSSI